MRGAPASAVGAAPDRPLRWTREFLVYLEPVGSLSATQFAAYAALLRSHAAELPIRTLTRPGGYAAELSPFRSFSWRGDGVLRFRFVSSAEARAESCDGADAHAWHRPVAILGLCHCPATSSLRDALAAFTAATARRFPSALVHKCFAFEPRLDDDRELEQLTALGNLVVFPAHHALAAGGSTVSLHLQVVMDTLAVTVLLSLESTIRAAMRPQAALELGDGGAASFLLDTAVEPTRAGGVVQPSAPRLHTTLSSIASTAVVSTASALASPFATDGRSRKRQSARHRKLMGDYAVLLQCVPDALEHYATALELLREEERRSNGAGGDVLWLAAALDGYAYALSLDATTTNGSQLFTVDVIEKASEAAALYARAGVAGLECELIEKTGWYCVAVVAQLERTGDAGDSRREKTREAAWVKRLLWELIERGLAVFPDLERQRQLEFVVDASRMLECVGRWRRMALFLHEAAGLLLARNAPSGVQSPRPLLSAQRQRDLQAALILERLAAAKLGLSETVDSSKREVTTLAQSTKTRRGHRETLSPTATQHGSDAWLVLRFHVLRQLLTIAKLLGDPFLVGKYGIQLLQLLPQCDALASPAATPTSTTKTKLKLKPGGSRKAASGRVPSSVDQLQTPFTALRAAAVAAAATQTQSLPPVDRQGLFSTKTSVFYSPPSSVEVKTKRTNFSLAASSSATMSSAAASLSSTIASTPRMLATPRQQFSAAVSAISTKASPAFASFAHHASPHGGFSTSSSSASGSPSVAGLEDVGSPGFNAGSSGPDSNFERGSSGSGNSVGQGGTGTPRKTGARAGTPDRRLGSETTTPPVWNLRSKEDVVRLERNVLSVLESECAALQASEQGKLPAFLGVDSMRVRTKLEHPFMAKAAALAKYAQSVASESLPSPGSAASPDFFYSPFEKQTRNIDSDAGSGSGDAEAPDSVFPVYEKIELEMVVSNPFGVSIEVQQATAWVAFESDNDDNASTAFESSGRADSSSRGATDAATVECYPCSLSLAPYETRKSVLLGVQPLREGAFRVRGCFLTVLNLKTSFELATSGAPVFRVVGRLPLASLSLCEVGSLVREPATARSRRENLRLSMFSSETKRCELRVRNVGQNAITRCRLAATVRRPRQAVKKTVVLFDSLSDLSTTESCDKNKNQLVNIAETDSTTLRCTSLRNDGDSDGECCRVAPKLPMENGDSVSVQFEILLQKRGRDNRHASDDAPLEEEEEIVWSFVYADDDADIASLGASSTAVFYRETTLTLQLVSLPSLRLSGVSLVPSTSESIPSTSTALLATSHHPLSYSAVLDNSHCVLVVEVTNPTETAFRFRMRRTRELTVADDDGNDEADADSEDGNSDVFSCDVEIGRKCARRVAIELPRLHPRSPLLRMHARSAGELVGSVTTLASLQRTLASLLNALVTMEWATHFGTNGTLRFEDHLWSSDAAETHFAMLLLPELAFEVAVSESFAGGDSTDLGRVLTPINDNDDDDESAIPMLHGDASRGAAMDRPLGVSHSPFIFFHGAHLTGERRQLAVRMLEFVPIAIEVRRLWRHHVVSEREDEDETASQVSIEVRITQDGHEDNDNDDDDVGGADEAARADVGASVVVVGMLQRDFEWPLASGSDTADRATADEHFRHELQVLFLSSGDFRVSVCGRVLDTARNAVREIWSHEPLYIRASEEST